MAGLKILYLESDDNNADSVLDALGSAGTMFQIMRVTDITGYQQQLAAFEPDAVLCPHHTGDITYTDALQLLQATGLFKPFILLTDAAQEAPAVKATEQGVDDYLLTDRLLRLPSAIANAVQRRIDIETNTRISGSEQRLLALIENSGEMVSVAGLYGEIIYTSNNVQHVLGYTVQQYIAMRFDPEFIHPDDKERQLEQFRQTRENPGVVYDFSWRLRHAKGHWVWVAGKVTNLLHVPAVKGIVANFKDVSEQRDAEEKLAQSEQRYRHIVETAQEGIWMLDTKNVTLFVNKKMADMLGYTVDEILGRPNYDFKPFAEKQVTIDRVQHRTGAEIETHESAFLTKDGKTLICRVSTNGIFDPGGNYLGTLAMITDITELKMKQEALQQSEANLMAIIENTNDLVYSLDRDLRFITFNNSFKNTINAVYNLDVQQGINCLDMIAGFDPDVAKKWRGIYQKALEGETQQFVNEYPVGNNVVYLSYSVNPIRDGDDVIGLSCFSRDITRQRNDELALIQSEANLRSVFENTDLAIMLYDLDLNLVSFNTNAVHKTMRVLGKELQVGKSVYEYFPQERWATIKDMLSRIKLGQVISYELFYEMLDGATEWMESRWFGVTGSQQEIVGVILTLKNISAQKEAEQERERMTNDILKRNRDLEQFTYIISHNVRAPIANIKGLTNFLVDAHHPDPGNQPIVNALAASADQLDKVIIDLNQILQTDKQLHENKDRVIFGSLIDQIKLSIQAELLKYNATINHDFSTVPELFTVKSYIHSIFHNLITNSIKYRMGDIAPVIAIQSVMEGNNVVINYQDNGRGIDLTRYGNDLFGLYKRFDFSVEGKGMGLFMVRQQVHSLGGNISVSSKPGKGTQFKIELPV